VSDVYFFQLTVYISTYFLSVDNDDVDVHRESKKLNIEFSS